MIAGGDVLSKVGQRPATLLNLLQLQGLRCGDIAKPYGVILEAKCSAYASEVKKVHPCTGTEALYRPYGP
jgi:hypothetical protein